MKRFFQIGCAPRPDMPLIREMTRDDAILKVLTSFRENFPESHIVATYLGKMGYAHNFVVSVSMKKEEK